MPVVASQLSTDVRKGVVALAVGKNATPEEKLVAMAINCRCAQEDIVEFSEESEAVQYVVDRLEEVIKHVDKQLLACIKNVVQVIRLEATLLP